MIIKTPVLDISALGFFRAELVGYDKLVADMVPNPTYPNIINYAPFMVFQKTCSSGTIINVNSNEWCAPWGIGLTGTNPSGNPDCPQYNIQSNISADRRLQPITANMIELMIQDQTSHVIGTNNGDNLFFNPRPSPSMSMKPAYTNVSYNACSGGSIHFTPCGVYINDGYKVDNGFTFNHNTTNDAGVADINNNIFTATIDPACINYNNGLRQIQHTNKPEAKADTLNKVLKSGINIFPNPSSGIFTLQNQNVSQTNAIEIYNTLGEKVYSTTNHKLQATNIIDLSSEPKGIYFVKIQIEENIFYKKIVVQ